MARTTKTRRGPMTTEEMKALVIHPNWGDGRYQFLFCRLSAIIDRGRWLRAELTWMDDSDDERGDPSDTQIRQYYDPELFLESNRPEVRHDGTVDKSSWVTVDSIWLPLTRAEAELLARSHPAEILDRYEEHIRNLILWEDPDAA